jgi:hypothetical protein
MAYGMNVNGDNNRLLFSTNVNGLFFQGKATLHQIFTTQTTDYVFSPGMGRILFDWCRAAIYEFRITLPSTVTSIMPFIHNTVGKRVAFLSIYKENSTVWSIILYACTNPNTTGAISSAVNVPQVYVFSDFLAGTTNTGHGINTINESGKVTFSTNAKPLIFNALYNANIRFSNLVINQSFPFSWVGNGPAFTQNISYHNSLLPVAGISKPAIFFSGNQTARRNNPTFGDVFIGEATARFLPVTGQLAIEWAEIATSFSLSNINQQSTSPPFTAMVIDAAQYD